MTQGWYDTQYERQDAVKDLPSVFRQKTHLFFLDYIL